MGFSALALVGVLATAGCTSVSAATISTRLVACAPASNGENATTAAMSSILSSIKEQDNLSAIIFSAEQNGKPILRTALGTSTSGVPATTDMHFRIGAVGWQYLTGLLLLMVDRKQSTLTDPVSKWFERYPYASLATVRMLAASSTGFGDYITPPAFGKEIYANTLRVWTADDLITRSLPPYQKPAFTDPGKNWAYSHTDFVMLGSILEQISGKPYVSLLQQMILDPLALHDTRLQFDDNPQRPVLQTLDDETYRDTTFWNPSWVSWAAMTSNVCDLAIWNRAFGTGSLLSPASKAEVTAPVNVGLGGNAAKIYFGLGTLVYVPWIMQKASYWGMYTSTAYDPTTGISLEVTTSLNPRSAPKQPSNDIISAISRLLTPDHPIPN
jgi:D-alanyl-D-alanine carboxypeptidase